MLSRCLHAAIWAGTSVAMLVGSAAGLAQTTAPSQTAPSQVTPQTLRPSAAPDDQAIVLPKPSGTAPAGANSSLTVEVGDVQLHGSFRSWLLQASQ